MRKRVKSIILVLLILVVSACVIILSFLVFSKPKVTLIRFEITPGEIAGKDENGVPDPGYLESIQRMLSENEENGLDQTVWEEDELPSDALADYSSALVFIQVRNPTMFDCYIRNALIDGYDFSSELLMTNLSIYGAGIESSGEDTILQRLDLFTSGKSEEEIAEALRSIRLQILFSDRIYSMSNVYADCKDAEIVFVGDDG